MSDILDRIDVVKASLADYTDEAKQQVNLLEKTVKQALLAKDLSKHDGIKQFLKMFELDVKSIENRLLTDRKLDDLGRALLFERKDWCEKVLGYFTRAESNIASTEEIIQKYEETTPDGVSN